MNRSLVVSAVFALLISVTVPGAEACGRFLRIVSTQATEVVGLDLDSGITWSNATTDAVCAVQWSPDPRGPWLTNHLPSRVVCTATVHRLPLPWLLTHGVPSTILYRPPGSGLVSGPEYLGGDLDADGSRDVSLWVESISSTDVPSSSHYTALHVETHSAEVILRPYTNGESIIATPEDGYPWISAAHYGPALICSSMVFDFEHGGGEGVTWGPWFGKREAFLPVRLLRGERTLYGWVRVSLAYFTFNGVADFWFGDFRIGDCGLQTAAGMGLRAGER